MSDAKFFAALVEDLARPLGYIRHGTFQAVCRRAAAAGDRAFVAASPGTNRNRLLAAISAATRELEKAAQALATATE
jgi:hypothetical protein